MAKSSKYSGDKPSHSGIIGYRITNGIPEILLVTSSGSGRWVIPKGHIVEEVGSRESARREAFEEAGVEGELEPTSFRRYLHGDDEEIVEVFLMRVTYEASTWPEQGVRQRRWVPISEVASVVDDPDLSHLLRKAAASPGLGMRGQHQWSFSKRGVQAGLGGAALLLALVVIAPRFNSGDPGRVASASKKNANVEGTVASGRAAGAICRISDKPAKLPSQLTEASGVAASLTNPGVLWTHNDSGEPYVYAVDREGNSRGRVRLTGAKVVDWESIDLAPCATGQCLYVGDIGDNGASRSEVVVYRVPEPAVDAAKTAAVEVLRGRYPDGPNDAEALFVSPEGSIYIVTKGEGGPVSAYRFPRNLQAGSLMTLELVRVLADGKTGKKSRVTGADMSADGSWIVLRTRDDLSFYRTRDFSGNSGPAKTMDISDLKEPQGEGVSFGATSRAVVLTGEGGKKSKPGTVTELDCALDS